MRWRAASVDDAVVDGTEAVLLVGGQVLRVSVTVVAMLEAAREPIGLAELVRVVGGTTEQVAEAVEALVDAGLLVVVG